MRDVRKSFLGGIPLKKFKILFFVLVGLFLIPSVAYAEDATKHLYMTIDILEDGSIHVRELAELSGNYNGRLRDISYQNLYAPPFTGTKDDFYGSDIYNGRAISNLKIGDVSLQNGFSFDLMDEKIDFYREVSYASKGEYGVYTKEETFGGVDLTIYNPSSRHRAFYMEYDVLDVVVEHEDVSEFAWNILSDTYQENIDDLQVIVRLPKDDDSMRVWAHGPLNGEIKRLNDREVMLIYDFLGAYNATDIRMMFSHDVVPFVSKKTKVNAKHFILEVEEEKANRANREREKIKLFHNVTKAGTVLWTLSMIGVGIYIYIKYDKEHKVSFDMEYYRDFPRDYGPEVLQYLLKQNVSTDALSASFVELIRKKVILLEEIPSDKKKKNYLFKANCEDLSILSRSEQILFHLFIHTIGDGEKVTLKEIQSYGKSEKRAKVFLEEYRDWQSEATSMGKDENFFYRLALVKILPCLLSILGIFVFIINLVLDTNFILGYVSLPFAIISLLYFMLFSKRTEKGALEYKQWMAFKHFLEDFGRMDEKELPEVALWDKYLVYAMPLGCADRLEKDMKMRLQAMNEVGTIHYDMGDMFMMHYIMNQNLTHAIDQSVKQAVSSSYSSIAASHSSSAGGFGGGVSSGGGSFGGGGGGGRF